MQGQSAAISMDQGGDGDAMTPGELAYFNSGGNDATGLDLGNAPGEPAGGRSPAPANDQGKDQNAAPDANAGQDGANGEDDGEEVVVLGKDGKPRAQNGRFVPHQALHKERERRKGVETELQAVRERQARADERLAVLNEILASEGDGRKPATDKPVEPIDPQADPLGALQQALGHIQRLEKHIKDRETQQGERESARAMQSAYQNDALRYVQDAPDFKDAYKYLIEGRHRELEAMGMTDANQRNQFIANEERSLVSQAFQLKRSPAQMIHNLAIARGFAPTAAPAQNGDPAKAHAEKIERIANGQKAAGASLSGAGGSSGEGLTAAALADMSEEDFAAMSAKLGKAKMRQLLGG